MGLNKFGLFSPSANSAALPGTDQARPPRGPVPDGTKTFDSDDFSGGTIQPAKTAQQLQAQIGQLILVFQDAEGREPAPGDPEFWSAYNSLIQSFIDNYEAP
jgi:hypothetical protein